MVRLAILGAGRHSLSNHLPACAELARRFPGRVDLVSVCDLDLGRAEAAAQAFGFTQARTSLEEMAENDRPDGVVAVTPIDKTADVARQLIDSGMPACIEKPPGATLEEAASLADYARRHHARIMVSVNRRFAPPIAEARGWLADRSPRYVHARMVRHARRNPRFLFDTGIHAVDTVRHLAGDIAGYACRKKELAGSAWTWLDMTFASGGTGRLEILPTAGMTEETYTLFGPDWRVICRIGAERSPYLQCFEGGRPVLERSFGVRTPAFVRGGAYGEMVAFAGALEARAPFFPALDDVLPSMQLCEALELQEPCHV